MNRLKSWFLASVFAVFVGGFAGSVATPSVALAATTCQDATYFLTLPPWYRGLNISASDCGIVDAATVGGLGPFIWAIVLNVIEMGLHAVGYIAVAMIIYGGFKFMTGQGDPENITKARKTIRDAVVGLVISVASIAIVNLVAGAIIT